MRNVLDVRPGNEFAAGHVPGSISIALSGQFASWAGGILGIHSKPVLIGDSDAQVEEARLRLARVGIEDLRGYLAGGVAAWREAGLPVVQTAQISVRGTEPKAMRGKLGSARRARRAPRRRMASGPHPGGAMPRAGRVSARIASQSMLDARLPFTARADTAA